MDTDEIKKVIREEIHASYQQIVKNWSEKFNEVQNELK